ncbi:MAG: hypothetical protein AABZ44_02535 [Elusimicrobiota bacterium]
MDRNPCKKHIPKWAALLAVLSLFLSSVWLWKSAVTGSIKHDEIKELLPAYYDPATVRSVRTEMTFESVPCQSCHEGKEQLQGNPKGVGVFHESIELKHGRNQHCFNCHHRLQPAEFSNFDGEQIGLANIELLCSRCHGTTYRDWLMGAHGRRIGFWDKAKGTQQLTVCIACHDPHWPIFKGLQAAPAPHVNPRAPKTTGKTEHAHERVEGG